MRDDPFYHSRRWERVRGSILRRDGYMCQESKRFGKMVQANTVHHIFPREQYPQYAWAAWNMISLCADQHNRMHYRDDGRLTDAGKDLLRRTATKLNMEYDEPW